MNKEKFENELKDLMAGAKDFDSAIIARIVAIHGGTDLMLPIIEKARRKRRGTRRKFFYTQCSYVCNDCGNVHPATIEFHHHHPENKRFSPGEKAGQDGAWLLIYDEVVNRTVAVCRNCHAIRHW